MLIAAILVLVWIPASPIHRPFPVETPHTTVQVVSDSVPVQLIPQPTCCWCWAASGQMVMRYFGVEVQQCTQAASQFSVPSCCSHGTNYPSACVSGGSVWISHYGFTAQGTGGTQPLGFTEMMNQISQRHEPWILNYHWPASGALTFGHVLVGSGYQTHIYTTWDKYGNKTVAYKERYVKITDPWPQGMGGVYLESYSKYAAGTYYGQQYIDGYDTYDIIPPPGHRHYTPANPTINRKPADVKVPEGWKGPFGATPEIAAQNSLVVLRSMLGPRNYAELGFESETPGELHVGSPIYIKSISLVKLRTFSEASRVLETISDAPSEIFPVYEGTQVRAMIQVSKTENGWEGVKFGQANMAKLLERLRQEHNANTLVHMASLNYFFLAKGQGEQLTLTPIVDDNVLKFKAGGELSARDALTRLAPAAKAYNSQPR